MGGGDLTWQSLLDDEIVHYAETFQDELHRMSNEIRGKLKDDLEKQKNFY